LSEAAANARNARNAPDEKVREWIDRTRVLFNGVLTMAWFLLDVWSFLDFSLFIGRLAESHGWPFVPLKFVVVLHTIAFKGCLVAWMAVLFGWVLRLCKWFCDTFGFDRVYVYISIIICYGGLFWVILGRLFN
jgi:hypothetical protein